MGYLLKPKYILNQHFYENGFKILLTSFIFVQLALVTAALDLLAYSSNGENLIEQICTVLISLDTTAYSYFSTGIDYL
jgi:hypothetical protein